MYHLYDDNSSDFSDYHSYGSIYESYEWDDSDSDDWSSWYDLYEWDSDLSYWVVVSPTPSTDTPLASTTTTTTALPPQSTTSDFFTASFADESNNVAQCGISSALLLETPEDPGSALVAIKDPPTGIQMVEISNVIINGKDVTDPTLFPWMAALRTNSGFHYCGGAIISEWWILTAAHCEFEKESSVVVAGTLARSNGAGEIITRASAIYNHPKADVKFLVLTTSEPNLDHAVWNVAIRPDAHQLENSADLLGLHPTDLPSNARTKLCRTSLPSGRLGSN
jgi:hypothetical protein